MRAEWILSQWLSSILGKNVGQAGDQTSYLLFSSMQHYHLCYGTQLVMKEMGSFGTPFGARHNCQVAFSNKENQGQTSQRVYWSLISTVNSLENTFVKTRKAILKLFLFLTEKDRSQNSLPSHKILDQSKYQAFADNKINLTQKLKSVLGWKQNILGKGENAGFHKHFLPQGLSRNYMLTG